jgi:hypothetical protein
MAIAFTSAEDPCPGAPPCGNLRCLGDDVVDVMQLGLASFVSGDAAFKLDVPRLFNLFGRRLMQGLKQQVEKAHALFRRQSAAAISKLGNKIRHVCAPGVAGGLPLAPCQSNFGARLPLYNARLFVV